MFRYFVVKQKDETYWKYKNFPKSIFEMTQSVNSKYRIYNMVIFFLKFFLTSLKSSEALTK